MTQWLSKADGLKDFVYSHRRNDLRLVWFS